MDTEPFLTFDVKNDIVKHMLEDTSVEVCGVITLSAGVYRYGRKKNISRSPKNSFKMTKADTLDIVANDEIVAYVHTHPNGPIYPSRHDMEIQISVQKPSVICALDGGLIEIFSFGNHMLDLPLAGRKFIHCAQDCYEAIRSWRWQHQGVIMGQYPRSSSWWEPGEAKKLPDDQKDFYSRCYVKEGYVRFEPNLSDPSDPLHPKAGDLVLMQLGGIGVLNHAGIYIGNNLIYHHRQGKRSGASPLGYCVNSGVLRMWARQGIDL